MGVFKDYYAVLGILPSAEDVVIRAAFKALALRYHPDRVGSQQSDANLRMAELNEAYEVLSNPNKREKYDQERKSNREGDELHFGNRHEDKRPTYDPLEDDWDIAVAHHKDLPEIVSNLEKISWRLAYSFKAVLLETKTFDRKHTLASALEQGYLRTYFGDNESIKLFAKQLIHSGSQEAARYLNKSIKILGDSIDANVLIEQVCQKYNVVFAQKPYEELNLEMQAFDKDSLIWVLSVSGIILVISLVIAAIQTQ